MEAKEVYVRSLLVQYRVFRLELIIFTIFFILAILAIPVAWYVNHVQHDYRLGCVIGFVAICLGLATALQSGNSLRTIRRVTTDLNRTMDSYSSFEYDQGKETDPTRFAVTTAVKIIGVLLALWCFIRWPQL